MNKFEKLKEKLAKRNKERTISPLEKWVAYFLRTTGIYGFTMEHQVDWYFIDIAWPDLKFGVELDGKEFHQNKDRDERRDEYLRLKGWEIMRIPSSLCWREELLSGELEKIFVRVFPGRPLTYGLLEMDKKEGGIRGQPHFYQREKELIFCNKCDICHVENNCDGSVDYGLKRISFDSLFL